MNDVEQIIRDAHKSLVCAAEKVIRKAFGVDEEREAIRRPEKSQLNHLAALCNEASCKEEIVNFIEYQVGRKGSGGAPWSDAFAKLVIEGINGPLQEIRAQAEAEGVSDERTLSRLQARAWGRYVVFLTRAYTYQDKVRLDKKKNQDDEAGNARRTRS